MNKGQKKKKKIFCGWGTCKFFKYPLINKNKLIYDRLNKIIPNFIFKIFYYLQNKIFDLKNLLIHFNSYIIKFRCILIN